LDKNLPEDVAFAESRIRGETIGAEDILHDLGAISMMSSDSQAMGRIGELQTRTWQTAHKMKEQRGHLPSDQTNTCSIGYPYQATGEPIPAGSATSTSASTTPSSISRIGWNTPHDNFRVRRYLAKYTRNPSIAHGISHIVGGVRVGLLADLVLWTPAGFGSRPHQIIKGGVIVASQMGDANASIPTPQPSFMRKMFGAYGKSDSHIYRIYIDIYIYIALRSILISHCSPVSCFILLLLYVQCCSFMFCSICLSVMLYEADSDEIFYSKACGVCKEMSGVNKETDAPQFQYTQYQCGSTNIPCNC
jgi:hypothetical protein